HGTRSGDGELLLDLPGAAVGSVVALHHHDLRAADQGAVDRLVVSQLKADHIADLDRSAARSDIENAGMGSWYRLRTNLLQQRDERQQLSTEGNPLAERHQILLVVVGKHSAIRIPPQRRGLTLVITRTLHDSAYQNRTISHLCRRLYGLPGERVNRRVDVCGVLRPEQEVRLRLLTKSHLGHQVDGFGQVVVRDRTGTTHRLDAAAGDVALHDPNTHAAGRSGSGLNLIQTQGRAEQTNAEHSYAGEQYSGSTLEPA